MDSGTASNDIYIARSTDSGTTFPPEQTLHLSDALHFPGQAARDQSFTSITVDAVDECGQGISILFWQDEGHGLYRPYYASQPDISVAPLMPNAFPLSAPGHYQEITSWGSMVYAAFPARVYDGQWSNNALYVSHIRTCVPDTDGDGAITSNDISEFNYQFASGSPKADLNQDGHVDTTDSSMFMQAWSSGCQN